MAGSSTLSPKTVNWALEHFAHHNDTDIFPRPFEFQALYHCRDAFAKSLAERDVMQWNTRAARHSLVPKQRYGFRLATQLDPLDMVVYFGLFFEAGESIEKARLPADRHVAFSYRFAPDSTSYLAFSRAIGFAEFRQYCQQMARQHPFVAVTDIADFYPRIYLHRLENSLAKALQPLPNHAKAIIRLLKGWNQNISYGIPIGNSASRLFAEIAIDDIDRSLVAEGLTFTRYVDDYRLFAASRQDAYKALVRLANALYYSHGLTLQAQKTKILSAEEFVDQVLETDAQKEIRALDASFGGILQDLGIDNPYEDINYSDLAPDVQKKIDGLNLENLLYDQLGKDEIDISMTKFLINRLGQIRRMQPLDALLGSVDSLHPVLPEIVRFLSEIGGGLSVGKRSEVGALLLGRLQGSVLSSLDFNKMQIMSLFAGSNEWGNTEQLARYYSLDSDAFFRRAVLLALGKSGQDFWLREKKATLDQMPPWDRRAFVYAASCFPADERAHWYNAILKNRDELEKYIIPWALKNPIA